MVLDGLDSAPADQLRGVGLAPRSSEPAVSSEMEDQELMEANEKGAQALAELWTRRMREQARKPDA
jgi:hypothetical protein